MPPTTHLPSADSAVKPIPTAVTIFPPQTVETPSPADVCSTADFRDRLLAHFRTARNIALAQAPRE